MYKYDAYYLGELDGEAIMLDLVTVNIVKLSELLNDLSRDSSQSMFKYACKDKGDGVSIRFINYVVTNNVECPENRLHGQSYYKYSLENNKPVTSDIRPSIIGKCFNGFMVFIPGRNEGALKRLPSSNIGEYGTLSILSSYAIGESFSENSPLNAKVTRVGSHYNIVTWRDGFIDYMKIFLTYSYKGTSEETSEGIKLYSMSELDNTEEKGIDPKRVVVYINDKIGTPGSLLVIRNSISRILMLNNSLDKYGELVYSKGIIKNLTSKDTPKEVIDLIFSSLASGEGIGRMEASNKVSRKRKSILGEEKIAEEKRIEEEKLNKKKLIVKEEKAKRIEHNKILKEAEAEERKKNRLIKLEEAKKERMKLGVEQVSRNRERLSKNTVKCDIEDSINSYIGGIKATVRRNSLLVEEEINLTEDDKDYSLQNNDTNNIGEVALKIKSNGEEIAKVYLKVLIKNTDMAFISDIYFDGKSKETISLKFTKEKWIITERISSFEYTRQLGQKIGAIINEIIK